MAKHVLDLFELYRLVVAKGGLVEVINKKLWREITKGLNLPSSITSAAFTLRTQYMKYLYPYECEKLKMSSPSELQAAIDGNRREGRRPVYGFEYSSPTGMSSSSNNNLANIGNPTSAMANMGNTLVKPGVNLTNDMGHHSMHHPHHSMLPHSHNSHPAASFFAALAAQHSGNNLVYEPNLADSKNLHSSHNSQNPVQTPVHNEIPSFLKQFYFNMNTPPSSSSSSSSSSNSSNRAEPANEFNNSSDLKSQKTNLENENNNLSAENSNLSVNSRGNSSMLTTSSGLKRPFEHYDDNSDNTQPRQTSIKSSYSNELKEPIAKKLTLDCTIGSATKANTTSYTASLLNQQSSLTSTVQSKMKIKILSKDSANDLTNLDKAIAISIELNGFIYNGTLFANEQTDTLDINSNNSKFETASSSLKADAVY